MNTVTGQERILCAAIWYRDLPKPKIQVANVINGVVLCGHRHGHIIQQLLALTGKRSVIPEVGQYIQGFLTNHNRFVPRDEAMTIAVLANQVINRSGGHSTDLFSEDLY